MLRFVLVLAVLPSLVCSIVQAAPPSGSVIGVRPGEGFTYRLSVGPIEGARARMSVGAPVRRDGHMLVAVQGEAETISLVNLVAPVTAAYKLVLDASTLLPREITSTERGLRNRTFHSLVDGRALDITMTSAKKNGRALRKLSREIRDPLSAYFVLRASRLKDGDELELDVLDGLYIWRSHLRVVRREPIELAGLSPDSKPLPAMQAIRLEGSLVRVDDAGVPTPKIRKRSLAAWIGDDASRPLLRAEFDSELGRAKLEMTSYEAPAKAPRLERAAQVPPGVYAADGKPAKFE
jgi:hypothetical protein